MMNRRQLKRLFSTLRTLIPPVVMPLDTTDEEFQNLVRNMRAGGYQNLIIHSGRRVGKSEAAKPAMSAHPADHHRPDTIYNELGIQPIELTFLVLEDGHRLCGSLDACNAASAMQAEITKLTNALVAANQQMAGMTQAKPIDEAEAPADVEFNGKRFLGLGQRFLAVDQEAAPAMIVIPCGPSHDVGSVNNPDWDHVERLYPEFLEAHKYEFARRDDHSHRLYDPNRSLVDDGATVHVGYDPGAPEGDRAAVAIMLGETADTGAFEVKTVMAFDPRTLSPLAAKHGPAIAVLDFGGNNPDQIAAEINAGAKSRNDHINARQVQQILAECRKAGLS